MNKTVLVTGGAGYIGLHTTFLLRQCGYNVVVLDSLIYNQTFKYSWAELITGDFADSFILDDIFERHKIDVVMHFAGFIEVGASAEKPLLFYENNVIKTIQLLNKMIENKVRNFIFSSSCAVYGVPQYVPIDEKHSFNPLSPYGHNKLIVEYVLQDYAQAYGLRYVSLRYFNAAGALLTEHIGEQHNPETHVIPNLMRAALLNKDFQIFGDDYATVDGSCVRDYVHVLDIAQAHVLAYDYLQKHESCQVFNLGSGTGYTVKQLIAETEHICGKKINTIIKARRPGDAHVLIADNTKAKSLLGWLPMHSDMNAMLASAYAWEKERLCM